MSKRGEPVADRGEEGDHDDKDDHDDHNDHGDRAKVPRNSLGRATTDEGCKNAAANVKQKEHQRRMQGLCDRTYPIKKREPSSSNSSYHSLAMFVGDIVDEFIFNITWQQNDLIISLSLVYFHRLWQRRPELEGREATTLALVCISLAMKFAGTSAARLEDLAREVPGLSVGDLKAQERSAWSQLDYKLYATTPDAVLSACVPELMDHAQRRVSYYVMLGYCDPDILAMKDWPFVLAAAAYVLGAAAHVDATTDVYALFQVDMLIVNDVCTKLRVRQAHQAEQAAHQAAQQNYFQDDDITSSAA
jgi:hypothetical protein